MAAEDLEANNDPFCSQSGHVASPGTWRKSVSSKLRGLRAQRVASRLLRDVAAHLIEVLGTVDDWVFNENLRGL